MSNTKLIGLCAAAVWIGSAGCSQHTADRFDQAGHATAQGVESSRQDVQRATGQAAQASGRATQRAGADLENEGRTLENNADRAAATDRAAQAAAPHNKGAGQGQ